MHFGHVRPFLAQQSIENNLTNIGRKPNPNPLLRHCGLVCIHEEVSTLLSASRVSARIRWNGPRLDSNGFSLGSQGDLLPAQTAHIVSIAQGCAKLSPEPEDKLQSISFETSQRTLSISKQDDLFAAVARTA